ncbi:MAG: phytanoyl-CoA dioxygenase family protein [Planctomycetes bacterium]|nr:phytanoyl-CoA dioxygenase family protein [Planctomycetota bacterium]
MSLSQTQIQEFNERGFIFLGRVIEKDRLADLQRRFDRLFAEKAGTVGQGFRNLAARSDAAEDQKVARQRMLQIINMWKFDPVYKELLYDRGLLDRVESLMGPNIQLFHDQSFYKPAHDGGIVSWHQDNGYWQCTPPTLVSIWIALDPATEENGCLLMLPGSHKIRYQHQKSSQAPILLEVDVQEKNLEPICLGPGEAVMHHCMTVHGSRQNQSARDRRGHAIHYMGAGTRGRDGRVLRDHLLLRGVLPPAEETPAATPQPEAAAASR